jgi:hypothetical protein
MADEPVRRIDQLPIDNAQLVDFAESRVVQVNLDNEVRIRGSTLPQFPSEPLRAVEAADRPYWYWARLEPTCRNWGPQPIYT